VMTDATPAEMKADQRLAGIVCDWLEENGTYDAADAVRASMRAHGYDEALIPAEHEHGLPEITDDMIRADQERTKRLSKAVDDSSLDVAVDAGSDEQVIPHGDGEAFPCPNGCPRMFALSATRSGRSGPVG
jgi:hypothetical protein